ncbi:MAG: hypothetical protein NTU91_03305 [Chloroflexi bacterium]|nr:hypothetical protein [Chloroflexota bacterium]
MKLVALPALLLALLAALTVIPLGEVHGGGYAPGEIITGHDGYTEYHVGDLPIILSLPHAGTLRPEAIADRSEAVVDNDPFADELAAELRAEIERLTGHPVHLIINQLHRSKMDANRSRWEGARGDPLATQAWEEYNGFLLAAKQAVVEQCGRGLLLDLHTNGRDGYLIEFGYGLTRDDLGEDDEHLNRESFIRRSTLRQLALLGPIDHADLLRGLLSLGGLMTSLGYAAEPSPGQPQPAGDPYFSGGYTIFRHGSMYGGWVDAVQIEVAYDFLRPAARANLIRALAASVLTYVDTAYGFQLTDPSGNLCPSFVDVPFEHPASAAIESLQADGVLSSCSVSPRRYCPWDAVTRADAAVMAVRLQGKEAAAIPEVPSFDDLPAERWDADSVAVAWSLGWLAACSEAPLRFCPEAPLTRGEVAHLAVSLDPDLLLGVPGETLSDVTAQPRALEAAAILHAGLLLPCQTTPSLAFCPESMVTRAELAQLLAAVDASVR